MLNLNSKQPIPKGITVWFFKLGHRSFNLILRALVVNGESPLCRVNLPWRLHLQYSSPNSYSCCQIFTFSESPIITLGGSLLNWMSHVSERAWAKDLPDFVATVARRRQWFLRIKMKRRMEKTIKAKVTTKKWWRNEEESSPESSRRV